MFLVAMSDKYPDAATAATVLDGDKRGLKEFYRDHVGCEIKRVDGEEMQRLLRNYIVLRS